MGLFVFISTTTTSQNIQHFIALDRAYWRLTPRYMAWTLLVFGLDQRPYYKPTNIYIFDITITEVLTQGDHSELQAAAHQLASWSLNQLHEHQYEEN
jgi:hypothetical protein